MKKTILSTTLLIAGAVSLLAQGTTFVTFDNDPTLLWGDPAPVDRLIYATQVGVDPVINTAWAAQLQENVGGNWVNVGPSSAFYGDFDGYRGVFAYDGIDRFASTTKGQTTALRIAVVDTGAGNALLGASPSFDYVHRSSVPPSPSDTLMVNFRAFAVPEPSTVALGVLGLGALLLFRRRR